METLDSQCCQLIDGANRARNSLFRHSKLEMSHIVSRALFAYCFNILCFHFIIVVQNAVLHTGPITSCLNWSILIEPFSDLLFAV